MFYPSMIAASAVHVKPTAIPIHGVWPNVPSLTDLAFMVFVAPIVPVNVPIPMLPLDGAGH